VELVKLALHEDLHGGQDWTTLALVPPETEGTALLVARRPGVIAGLPTIGTIAAHFPWQTTWEIKVGEGSSVAAGQCVARLEGDARTLLTAERVLLNFVGRLSGIATLTRAYVDAVQGTPARIYDTRKTTPGWRRLEKYAVRQGGGWNHRCRLSDAILIKDNHLAVGQLRAGISPAEAVRLAREFLAAQAAHTGDMIIEVEADTLEQLTAVLPERPDIVLLDNMSLAQLREAVSLRAKVAPDVELEASGGVALSSVRDIALTGVDRISVGALTHHATWLDVGLDWVV